MKFHRLIIALILASIVSVALFVGADFYERMWRCGVDQVLVVGEQGVGTCQ
jgi:hypothetical protein